MTNSQTLKIAAASRADYFEKLADKYNAAELFVASRAANQYARKLREALRINSETDLRALMNQKSILNPIQQAAEQSA